MLSAAISYENFKAEIERVDSHERALIYASVWATLRSLTKA
jgi:hypothetical protein